MVLATKAVQGCQRGSRCEGGGGWMVGSAKGRDLFVGGMAPSLKLTVRT